MLSSFAKRADIGSATPIPMHAILPKGLERFLAERTEAESRWLKAVGFGAKDGELVLVPNGEGGIGWVAMGLGAGRDPHALALCAERARFEAMRDSAEARLREDGDGFSLEALRAEVAGSPAEAHAAAIEAANTRRKTAVEAAQRATEEAASLRQTLDRKAEETGAIAAATDQQAALASLSSTLDEALVYHTAALLLGRALEAVEKSGDLAMSRRLGEIFAQLTCGAHTRVTTELDDSGKAGFGFVQRDFPEERQSIDQLSEGTRDQFFLALRVAAIETHLATAPPLPFIGDDILQTFDDDRALAALRVLSELSQRTQVIVLTHHRHLLDVATRLPEGTVFQCPREAAA